MKNRYWKVLGNCLSDILLFGFATSVLFLFVMMGFAPDRCLFVGELNIYVWVIEIVAWILCIAWATRQIISKIKRGRICQKI